MIRTALFPLVLLATAAGLTGASPATHYGIAKRIAGPDGGWDYARIDPASRVLYVAHGDSVLAVDLAHGDKVRSFGAIAHGHAVVPIPGHRLLVTSGHDDSVRLFDSANGQEVGRIEVGTDPDAAFYDDASGQAAVMNAKAGTVSVIDVAARKVVRTITLKPGLEFAVLGSGGAMFVNNEDENEIETVDFATGAAGASIAIPGCEGPTGLGYDARSGQLVSACANGKVAIVDAKTKRLVKLVDIGQGPDAVIVDSARRLAFVPCGKSGTMSVLALDAPGGARVIDTITTETGARTGALDPISGAIYLPTARFAAAIPPAVKPTPVSGSFHIVVVTRS